MQNLTDKTAKHDTKSISKHAFVYMKSIAELAEYAREDDSLH